LNESLALVIEAHDSSRIRLHIAIAAVRDDGVEIGADQLGVEHKGCSVAIGNVALIEILNKVAPVRIALPIIAEYKTDQLQVLGRRAIEIPRQYLHRVSKVMN